MTGEAEEADSEVSEAGHHSGPAAGADHGQVLTHRDITDPVQLVLYSMCQCRRMYRASSAGWACSAVREVTAYTVSSGGAFGSLLAFAGPGDPHRLGSVREG